MKHKYSESRNTNDEARGLCELVLHVVWILVGGVAVYVDYDCGGRTRDHDILVEFRTVVCLELD